jgi:uncharacterized protein DUF1657
MVFRSSHIGRKEMNEVTVASDVKQTFATIKNMESQLSSLALNSLDEGAKKAFHEAMLTMGNIKDDMQARVFELERDEPQYKGS